MRVVLRQGNFLDGRVVVNGIERVGEGGRA